MEFELKFKSIAARWFFNVFLVTAVFVCIIEVILCSLVRAVYVDRVRAKAAEYAQSFTALATVSLQEFYSTAKEYTETFEYKDKIEVNIIDQSGELVYTTAYFSPESETNMPDYEQAKKGENGTAYIESKTGNGEKVLCSTTILADNGSGSNGAIRYVVSLEETLHHVAVLRIVFLAVGLVVLGVTGLSGLYFIKSIVRPIRELSTATRKIATGDFEANIAVKENNEIGKLCDSINYMASELKTADNLKNDFISSVSHELRTPLTAIRGWGETAKMSIGTDQEIVEKGLDVVLKEAERLSSLVEELLDFSRIQSGRLSVNVCPIGVSSVLGEVADMYIELANQQKIQLTFLPPARDSVILGDKDRLKQVFINIIDNAVKYTQQGGQVLVEQYEEDGCVRIIVKDTGVGIPAQDIDRVKEKFFKSNKVVRGSGIGLAVADEIIKQHQGLLFIESTENVGTTVTIALPLALEPEVQETQEITILPDEQKGKTDYEQE